MMIFFALLLLCGALQAEKAQLSTVVEQPRPREVQSPWFTGPLLAPASLTIPPGHYNIEPYIYAMAITGVYDHHWKSEKIPTFWNNYFQGSLQFGLNKWADFAFYPTMFYNTTRGVSDWALGDMPILFDFQLFKHGHHVTEWTTAIKLSLSEILPLGKYRNLNPKKLGTDIGGKGSWQTAAGLVWGNLWYLGREHFLAVRFSFVYTWSAPVYVKNLNVYGGAKGTHGTIYPAQNFEIDIGSEFSFTRNWVFALDMVGNWTGDTRFKGVATAPCGPPPSAQFSLAPALEYNWSDALGIIFGSWFTVAGRNTLRFTGGVLALNYYH